MFRGILEEHGGIKIIGVDTITHVKEEDAGHIVLSASHGGTSAGSFALKYPLAAVFFNDAGVGGLCILKRSENDDQQHEN